MPYRQTAARFTPEPKWMASKLQGEETRAGPLAHGTLQTSTIIVCGSAAPKGRELPATSAEAREAAKSRSKASAGFTGAQCSHPKVYHCRRRGEPDPLLPRLVGVDPPATSSGTLQQQPMKKPSCLPPPSRPQPNSLAAPAIPGRCLQEGTRNGRAVAARSRRPRFSPSRGRKEGGGSTPQPPRRGTAPKASPLV